MTYKQLIKALGAFFIILFILVACATQQATPTEQSSPTVSPSETSEPTSTTTIEQVVEWNFVALGDSRTRGASWVDTWIEYIEADLGVKVKLNNWAFYGQPSEDILAALGDNENVREDIREAEIITIFTTDKTGQDIFISNKFVEVCPSDTYRVLLEDIISEISLLRAGNETIVRVFDHYNHPGLSGGPEDIGAKAKCVDVYNEIIHSVAEEFVIPVVPVFEAFNGPDGNDNPADKGYLQRDGIHASETGNQVIADLLHDMGYNKVILGRP